MANNDYLTNKEYVTEYYKTIRKLNADFEERAVKAIKEFGKNIDIFAIKAHDLNLDREDDEVEDAVYSDGEWAYFQTKNDNVINCVILEVRYNKDKDRIEALLKDPLYDAINEWVDITFLDRDAQIAVYTTILEYIDQAKELE